MSSYQFITHVNSLTEANMLASRALVSLLQAQCASYFNTSARGKRVIVIATDGNDEESIKRVNLFVKHTMGLLPTVTQTDVPHLNMDWFFNSTVNMFINPEYVTSGDLCKALKSMNASIFIYIKTNDVLMGKEIEEIASLDIPCIVSLVYPPQPEIDPT
jgi:hypothetical protein